MLATNNGVDQLNTRLTDTIRVLRETLEETLAKMVTKVRQRHVIVFRCGLSIYWRLLVLNGKYCVGIRKISFNSLQVNLPHASYIATTHACASTLTDCS